MDRLKGHLAVLEYALRGEFEDTSDWQVGSGFIESIELSTEFPNSLRILCKVMLDIDTPVLEYKGHVILYYHRGSVVVSDQSDDGSVFLQPFKQHAFEVGLIPQTNKDGAGHKA